MIITLEYTLENETHKILWEFQIPIDHPIRARRPDKCYLTRKNNLISTDFIKSTDHTSRGEKRRKTV